MDLDVRVATWLRGFVLMTTVAALVMFVIGLASRSSAGYVVAALLACLLLLTIRMQLLRFSVSGEAVRIVNPFRSYRLDRNDVVSLDIYDGEHLWIGPILVRGMLRIQKAVLHLRNHRDIHVVVLDWTDQEDELPFGLVNGLKPPDLAAMRLLFSGEPKEGGG